MSEDLNKIRKNKPLVHSITNLVVMNETANALLCLGALPIMAHAKEEMDEMVSISSSLVLNIGTLTTDWIDSMIIAGKTANKLNKPVILDPVGAGATSFRTQSSKKILDNVKVSILRGNAGEVAALAGIDSEVRGVESIGASQSSEEIAKAFAKSYGCTVAITGKVDVVCDGQKTALITNGDEMLSRVVGTGCISNVIIAAFAGINSDPFAASVGGLVALGIAGEIGAKISGNKPGTFHTELYNALYSITSEDMLNLAKVNIDN
ncbi:MAG: hydroxyethylthiazole kinase [Armatimonadota bacterium]